MSTFLKISEDFGWMEIITRNQLKTLVPSVYIIIDGANLAKHPNEQRMLLVQDEDILESLKLSPEEINIQALHHTLLFLQGTALNLSGYQRVFVRTKDNILIRVDPRLNVPKDFDSFQFMMYRYVKDGKVNGTNGQLNLMQPVKSDLGKNIPPGVRRICLYVNESEKIEKPKEFIDKTPSAIYIHLDPTQISYDEVLDKSYCVSNDIITPAAIAWRVIELIEQNSSVW